MARFLQAALLLFLILTLGAWPGIIGETQSGPGRMLPGPFLRIVFPLCSLGVLGGWPFLGTLTFFQRQRLDARQKLLAGFAGVVVSAAWVTLAILFVRVLLHPWGSFP